MSLKCKNFLLNTAEKKQSHLLFVRSLCFFFFFFLSSSNNFVWNEIVSFCTYILRCTNYSNLGNLPCAFYQLWIVRMAQVFIILFEWQNLRIFLRIDLCRKPYLLLNDFFFLYLDNILKKHFSLHQNSPFWTIVPRLTSDPCRSFLTPPYSLFKNVRFYDIISCFICNYFFSLPFFSSITSYGISSIHNMIIMSFFFLYCFVIAFFLRLLLKLF